MGDRSAVVRLPGLWGLALVFLASTLLLGDMLPRAVWSKWALNVWQFKDHGAQTLQNNSEAMCYSRLAPGLPPLLFSGLFLALEDPASLWGQAISAWLAHGRFPIGSHGCPMAFKGLAADVTAGDTGLVGFARQMAQLFSSLAVRFRLPGSPEEPGPEQRSPHRGSQHKYTQGQTGGLLRWNCREFEVTTTKSK